MTDYLSIKNNLCWEHSNGAYDEEICEGRLHDLDNVAAEMQKDYNA